MSAVATDVDLRDPEDVVDAILNRQVLALSGDDAPWELYRALRERMPAFKSDRQGMWILTGYAEALKALLHPHMDLGRGIRQAAADGNLMSQTFAPTMLYFEDPADTMRQRRLVRQAFTRQTVVQLRPAIERLVDGLLDELADRRAFDVMNDFADHIPVAVVCELLGVPRDDVSKFRDWTRLMAPATGAVVTEETMAKVEEAIRGLREYTAGLIEHHRQREGEDLLSKMIRARDEGHQLSEEELIGLSIFILSAGSDTTTQLITGAMYTFSRFPDELRRLREERDLMGNAIEEAIRHSGPVHYAQPRYLKEPMELETMTIPAGETVLPSVAGANRDPRHFDRPDLLDIGRADTRHLGFSQGMHLCIGAMLARLEADIALSGLLDRFAEIDVDQEAIDYVELGPMRGIRGLAVSAVPA